jgi:hypothetical protein
MPSRTRIWAATIAAAGLVAAGVGAPAASAASTATTTAASATYRAPVVSWVAPIVLAVRNHTAVVWASYRCSGGNAGTHLFIGLKQGALVDTDEHSTSQYADTFYSTNYNSDGPGLSVTCNGRQQVQRFVLRPDPYWAGAEGPLVPFHRGRALVQFCLFDSTNTGEDDLSGFAFNYSMKRVLTV